MSNIRVDVDYTIKDGTEIKFRSPADCSQITGLIVYYPGTGGNVVSKVFNLSDAHGNNVGNIDHLFAKNVVVKVILDVTKGMAFVQNADTNAYLEGRFNEKAEKINRGNFSGDLDIIGDGGVQVNSVVWVSKDAKSPFPDSWGWVETWASQSNSIVQRATQISGQTWVRTHYYKNATVGATWGDWIRIDSIKPKMTANTEYLTTEYWKGNPVYTKLVQMGKLTTEFVEVAHGASLYYVVGVEAMALDETNKVSFPIAYSANDNVDDIGVYVDTTNVTIHNPGLLSAYSGWVTIKYVK